MPCAEGVAAALHWPARVLSAHSAAHSPSCRCYCAGLGAPISVYLRCLSARRQCVGELLAGVHAVQEVQLLAGDPQGPDLED